MNIPRPSIRVSSILIAGLLTVTLHLAAQQASQPAAADASLPIFDVVAIHQNKSGIMMSSMRTNGDALVVTNFTLTGLLMNAYGIRQDLMSGLPGWANSVHFDLNAKVSDPDVNAMKNLTREQRGAMILALLQDRFHLRAHIEVKTLPVYDLVLAKGGSKLKENSGFPTPAPETPVPGNPPANMKPGSMWMSNSQMTAVGVPISNLSQSLAFRVQRNVIDKTGLTGKYDFTLKWRPTELEGKANANADDNSPDLFTALQEQLGLKLEPSKGPVDTLVIDHVEMPTEN